MKFILRGFLSISLLISSLIFFNNNANATHVAGGYIQFECTNTPGQYKISLILYRDCSGIALNTGNIKIKLKNNCNFGTKNVSLSLDSHEEVSQVCLNDQNNTTCGNGSVHGYEEYIFSAVISLDECDGWTASYDLSARNATQNVNNSKNTYFHVTTKMNTQTDNCNTSPTVTSQPEPYVCNGQPMSYNLGGFEPDGDSIVYSLVPATDQYNNDLNYGSGYSGSSPIPGASIDPVSGTVTFTPNTNGAFIFVIRMTEYDSNGNMLTQTDYEYQTFVMTCDNEQPNVSDEDPDDPNNPYPGGVSNPSGSIVQVDANSLKLCQGLQGCFDVVFKDPDAEDNLSITSNLQNVLPGASITETGSNPLIVHVCWTPTTTSGVVTLNFLLEDDACPITGQNNYAATIKVIKPGVVDVSTTKETCLGDDEGTVALSVTGGSDPISYEITGPKNDQNTTGDFDQLPPGDYDYLIKTDDGGCPLAGSFTIDPGEEVTLTSSSIEVNCFGEDNGSATALPTGTAPYFYVWTGGNAAGQSTQTASNLEEGSYHVVVTDALGCMDSIDITVEEPDTLIGAIGSTDVVCNGDATGKIDLSGVSGGTTPYEYNIDGGTFGSNTNFSGLLAGEHVVKIKDARGCISKLSETVVEPEKLKLTLDGTDDATCGINSGEVNVSANGGKGPYEYTDGTQTNNNGSFGSMSAGPPGHTITVTDDNGCTDDVHVTIGAVVVPTVSLDIKDDLKCFGGNNGKAVIKVTDGAAPVTYSLNGGTPQASNVFDNLPHTQTPYTVDIVDGNGCPASMTFTIDEPPILDYDATKTKTSCKDTCNGTITVVATGGTKFLTGDYKYSSDNGQTFSTNSTLEDLCAGPVTVVVIDSNGCQATSTITIEEPGELSADFINTDPLCRDGDGGKIEVTNELGGTPTFEYSVDGGTLQTGSTLTGLTAGPHTVTVQDSKGCEFTSIETLINPPGIDIVVDSMNESNCLFNDGEIGFHGEGVNAPFEYALTSGSGDPIIFQPLGGYTTLLAGPYKAYVKDTLGCIDSTFVGINDVDMEGELVDSSNLTCYESNDGTVKVKNIAGSLPVTFELDNSGSPQPADNFSGLAAGNHIVVIYDKGNCVFTIPFSLTQPDSIDFGADIIDVSCHGGSTGEIAIIDTIGGNGNFQFTDDFGATSQTTPFENLEAGDYSIMVYDENFCTKTKDFHVEEADSIEFTANVFDLDCHNDGTGEIIVVGATGGTGDYEYSIDGGIFQPAPVFSGLYAETYTLSVKDKNVGGCATSMDTIVNQPDTVQATYTPGITTCFEDCDGKIEVVAQGGTPGYLYSVDGGTIFTSDPIIDELCADTYVVTVVDDNGCTIESDDEVVDEPDKLTFVSDSVVSTCSDANGEINITIVNGGTSGYTYSIDNGTFGNDDNFDGLLEGTYTISVKDSKDCPATGQQEVTDEPSPVINFLEGTDPLCNGDANGEIEVTATGGTGTLSYSVDGGTPQASNIFTGLTATGGGQHTITIEDDNGCTDTKDIVLDQPDALIFVSDATDLTCFENSTGEVHVVPSGGTPAYEYSFDGAAFGASSSYNFIPAGSYDFIIKDAHGCEAPGTQVVTEPTKLVFDAVAITDAICKSDCNGEIQLNVSGGTGNYTYTWLQAVAGDVDHATGLCSDTYEFMVEDQNGCLIDSLGFVDEPDSVQITNIVPTNVTCNGDCDGIIEITSPTATEYSIDNGSSFQPANTFTALCDDDYIIIAKDADGCLVEGSAVVWQPEAMNLDLPNDTVVCYAYNLQVFAQASGGIQPYTYSWTNTPSTSDTLDIIATSNETYSLDIFDNNGCTVPTESITVDVLPQVDITVYNDTTICPGGTVVLTAKGAGGLPDYNYGWNTGDSTNIISVSPDSTTVYTATVTDQCGDEASAEATVNLFTPATVSFEADSVTGCIPKEVHFTNTTDPSQVGGNCLWTVNGETFPGCTDLDYTFYSDFCYDVSLQVTSPDGCVSDTTFDDFVCVDDYPVADFFFDPTHPTPVNNLVNFTNNSVGADTYDWMISGQGSSNEENPSITFNNIDGESVVTACLKAISQYGCVDEVCKEIEFKDEFELFVPNTFTPDNDDYNETFLPVFPPNSVFEDYHLVIFNRWGEILFESYDSHKGWDGTYGINSTKPVKDGVYIWKIHLKQNEDHDGREFVGHVTLLK